MKRINLISPPAVGLKDKLSYPPLGLLYLASNLEGGHKIKVQNMVTIDEPIDIECDIFGISMHSNASLDPARKIMQDIRKSNRSALLVAGGAFPTSMAEFTLENTEADVVVVGEGERVFSDLCAAGELEDVKGIVYKRDSQIVRNPPQDLIKDLDLINFPARSLLPRSMIRHEGKVHHSDKPATTVFGSRGCAYNCSFCDTELWRRRWRSRSPENIIAEIDQVRAEYGIDWFRFPDDCLNLNKKWFVDFCQKISKCKISWTMLSRADALDGDLLELMKQAGCREVFFGFETGSQKLLDLMQKKITVEQNIGAVEACRKAGITSCAYMLFGFPGEDEQTIEETKKFLIKAKPDKSRITQFIPIPGSDVWRDPQKYKVKIKHNFGEHWCFDCHPFALDYEYIGNDKMEELRADIMNFYQKQGYFKGWAN